MVYRILSIATHIAFGIMTLVGVVCLAYTLATPVVQAGVQQARDSIDQMGATAAESMQATLESQTNANAEQLQALLAQAQEYVSGIMANFTAPQGADGSATEGSTAASGGTTAGGSAAAGASSATAGAATTSAGA